jgi:hypothetical protein
MTIATMTICVTIFKHLSITLLLFVVFSPIHSNFPSRMRAIRKQGQLRTIIDDGEGAIPTDFALPANANGKERLRVMTCSDKILRWNGVGIQGGLLANFMDPIYLHSIVIGEISFVLMY